VPDSPQLVSHTSDAYIHLDRYTLAVTCFFFITTGTIVVPHRLSEPPLVEYPSPIPRRLLIVCFTHPVCRLLHVIRRVPHLSGRRTG